MEILKETYQKNINRFPLFDQVLYVELYDSPTEAVSRVSGSDLWYLCTMVYFNIKQNERIFSLLHLPDTFVSEVRPLIELYHGGDLYSFDKLKDLITRYVEDYRGAVFLFKSESLSSLNYELVELSGERSRYFPTIEDVLSQDEQSHDEWIQFFRHK